MVLQPFSKKCNENVKWIELVTDLVPYNIDEGIIIIFFFFLSLSLLTGWQLSSWNCCKPFFSLPCNCQLLCFWQLALSIVVAVFPRLFFRLLLLQGCLLQTRYA